MCYCVTDKGSSPDSVMGDTMERASIHEIPEPVQMAQAAIMARDIRKYHGAPYGAAVPSAADYAAAEWLLGTPEPTCDYCNGPESSAMFGNWNGETGNHLSCGGTYMPLNDDDTCANCVESDAADYLDQAHTERPHRVPPGVPDDG